MTPQSTSVDRVVVIGGSLAGASAAFGLRKAGFEGEVTLVGEERHLPYERPPLSKAYLRGEDPPEKALVRPGADYAAEGIEFQPGRRAMTVDRRDRTVTLDDGSRLKYDRLVLATGAAQRRLSATGAHLAGVRYLRTIEDADALRAAAAQASRVVVIGGGWIGSEVAASLRQMGGRVTLVSNLPRPLQRALGPELGEVYAELHRAHGVELVSGHVTALCGDHRVDGVRLTGGRTLAADLVVAGVGAAPRSGLALRAGLDVVDGGIAVNDRLQTSDPAIYAAGDVAAAEHPRYAQRIRVEHWDNAKRQGATVARNILDADESYDRIPYFYSDQFELGMEYRGRAITWDQVVVRGDVARREFLAFWLSEGRVVAAMNANMWAAGRELSAMVRDGMRIDPERLADPAQAMVAA